MEDKIFLFKFEKCSLEPTYFNHQAQLRLSWLYLKQYAFEHALIRTSQSIFCYLKHFKMDTYHETINQLWVHLVHQVMAEEDTCFLEFIEKQDYLLNENLSFAYYSPSLLYSNSAKYDWIEPDLKPLIQL